MRKIKRKEIIKGGLEHHKNERVLRRKTRRNAVGSLLSLLILLDNAVKVVTLTTKVLKHRAQLKRKAKKISVPYLNVENTPVGIQ